MPGPLVWEIEKVSDIVRVDGVVTVVDCANFIRINNFSRTAKIRQVHRPRPPQQGRARRRRSHRQRARRPPRARPRRAKGAHAGREGGDRPRHHLRPRRGAGAPASAAAAGGGGGGGGGGGAAAVREATDGRAHMAAEAEATTCSPRACRAAGRDARLPRGVDARGDGRQLYRTKGVVPLAFAEAEAEARQASRRRRARTRRSSATRGGSSTASPAASRSSRCARRRAAVDRLHGRRPLARQGGLEKALALPAGAVQSAGTLAAPSRRSRCSSASG